jgi:GNAT superfamily N-acetyltransferase
MLGIMLARHTMVAVSSIAVRIAKPNDLAFVSRDGHVSSEKVERMIADGRVYVATRNGEPVAYARMEYLWSKIPYLALIWVLEQHRRCGVGRALLLRIEQDAQAAGNEYLYSSSQANEPEPQAWHRRMGFAECGFIAGINRDGIGEVFFRKPLGKAASGGYASN